MLDAIDVATTSGYSCYSALCLESHCPIHFSLHYSLQIQSSAKQHMVNLRSWPSPPYCSEKLGPTCHQDLENGAFLQNGEVQMQDKNKYIDKYPLGLPFVYPIFTYIFLPHLHESAPKIIGFFTSYHAIQ